MNITSGKIILLILHGALLVPMFLDKSSNLLITSLVSVILLFTVIGNFRAKPQHIDLSSFAPFLVLIGGVSTYFLSVEMNLGAVIAASIIGLIASFIPTFISSPLASNAPAAVYCGSFVGMCTPMVSPNYTFVALASLFAGGIYLLVKNDLNGIGGKLGTVAFSGVILLTLLIQLMK